MPKIFFCYLYNYLSQMNGISLVEHDFLNFLHFWTCLMHNQIIEFLGSNSFFKGNCNVCMSVAFKPEHLMYFLSKPNIHRQNMICQFSRWVNPITEFVHARFPNSWREKEAFFKNTGHLICKSWQNSKPSYQIKCFKQQIFKFCE